MTRTAAQQAYQDRRNARLTMTQQAVLDYVTEFIAEQRMSPTRREISDHFGWKSANNAQLHLLSLERKHLLVLHPGTSRGIILPTKQCLCPHCGGIV